MTTKYKFEIAFSFLAHDESLAYAINDLIADRVETFIYSKRQEELGGTDGEIAFNEVFGKQSRTVAVLYRDGWGGTPWTRIEENAIRNRTFNEGWDFVTYVLLDKKSVVPIYVPKVQIWVDFERWGINGAATIIEQRIKEKGGDFRNETIEDRANRLKRLKKAHLERLQYLNTNQALSDANIEFSRVLSEVCEVPQKIQDNSSRLFFATRTVPNQYFEFGYHGLFLLFKRTPPRSVVSLEDNKLLICIYQKEGEQHIDYKETTISESNYLFDRSLTGELGWRNESVLNDFNTSRQLIDYWVKKYLDELEKRKIIKNF
jgi:hypothetical protein